MERKSGFTLIELLIVVAIIAILAAIAVPNFLEAQTRSKVARAESDLRTLNTGMMAYYVEYHDVPYDGNDEPSWRYYGWTYSSENGKPPEIQLLGMVEQYYVFAYLSPLTTPVAYITSVPHDPFTSRMPFAYDTRGAKSTGNFSYNMVASCGPDHVGGDWYRGNSDTGMAIPYDASNGTKSRGDIWRAMVIEDMGLFKIEYPYEYKQ